VKNNHKQIEMKKVIFLMVMVLTACSTPAKKGGETASAFIGETAGEIPKRQRTQGGGYRANIHSKKEA